MAVDACGFCSSARGRRPRMQATIIHTSLLRIVMSEPLPQATVDAIQAACAHWTAKLAGRELTSDTLWSVVL